MNIDNKTKNYLFYYNLVSCKIYIRSVSDGYFFFFFLNERKKCSAMGVSHRGDMNRKETRQQFSIKL